MLFPLQSVCASEPLGACLGVLYVIAKWNVLQNGGLVFFVFVFLFFGAMETFHNSAPKMFVGLALYELLNHFWSQSAKRVGVYG